MKHARLLLLAVSTLALLISACSQPADIQAPNLEPQFGTAAADTATAVAVQPGLGHVYIAGEKGKKTYLRQYNRSGSLNWERTSATHPNPSYVAQTLATDVDAQGNVYLAWDYPIDSGAPFISKLNRNGTLLWRKPFAGLSDMDVDAQGNIYTTGGYSVRKHTTSGTLVWERIPDTGVEEYIMGAVAVSPAGNVVAVGDGGWPGGLLVKFTNGGKEVFQTNNLIFGGPERDDTLGQLKVGFDETVAFAHTGFFSEGTGVSVTLQVFDAAGKKLWNEQVIQNSTAVPGVDISRGGSIYLTTGHWACDGGFDFGEQPGDGVSCTSGSDTDPERSAILTRKYTPSGDVVWSRVLNRGRTGTDESTAIAVASDSELYIGGNTVNKVNGANAGGLDAFLARLDGQGKSVWVR